MGQPTVAVILPIVRLSNRLDTRHTSHEENHTIINLLTSANSFSKSIEVRKTLTDEWDNSGVKRGEEYAALTDLMSRTWSGMTTRQYKQYKGLKKENLRDNMTNTELVLNMLAEVATTDISIAKQPSGFGESAVVAEEGAKAAQVAREQIEKSTGKPTVSRLNAMELGQRRLDAAKEGDGK